MRDGIERTAGFTLVELIVIITILVAMTAVTIPAISRWLPNYNLKRASMDLYSSMQLAKSEAIRQNRPYAVLFDPGNGTYQFIDSGPDREYEYPDVAADDIAGETLSISKYGPGLCNSGSVYLQNNNSRTYAIGTLMSGAVRIKMWRGSKWE
jgi:Tfp pilus assembly protein FimT